MYVKKIKHIRYTLIRCILLKVGVQFDALAKLNKIEIRKETRTILDVYHVKCEYSHCGGVIEAKLLQEIGRNQIISE